MGFLNIYAKIFAYSFSSIPCFLHKIPLYTVFPPFCGGFFMHVAYNPRATLWHPEKHLPDHTSLCEFAAYSFLNCFSHVFRSMENTRRRRRSVSIIMFILSTFSRRGDHWSPACCGCVCCHVDRQLEKRASNARPYGCRYSDVTCPLTGSASRPHTRRAPSAGRTQRRQGASGSTPRWASPPSPRRSPS